MLQSMGSQRVRHDLAEQQNNNNGKNQNKVPVVQACCRWDDGNFLRGIPYLTEVFLCVFGFTGFS